MRYTPERVTSLEANEIFVFGSTKGGAHRGGAAKLAVEKFGAVMGQGEGLQGQSYAIPSMLKTVEGIRPHVTKFLQFAAANPQWKFYVTKIGCGRAGFKEEEIAPLFTDAVNMPNIWLPQSFLTILGVQEEIFAPAPTPEPATAPEPTPVPTPTQEVVQENILAENPDESEFIGTTVPQLEGPKIVGTIDLSKLPSRRKCYIIDTNVFIDCPDIISKISRADKIVLSAKVVDELDAAKVRLDEEGKQNAARALRLINANLKPRKIEMVCADMSLLPDDFGKSPDNMILSVAMKFKGQNAIMLTSDNGLQIKSKGFGIKTMSLKDFL